MFLPQTYVSDSHHADVWTSTHGSNRKGMATPRTSALPLSLSVCAFWNPHNGKEAATLNARFATIADRVRFLKST